jgi:hypothetical protein
MDVSNGTQQGAVKTSDWVITFLISSIPLVGFIMLFVWAFGSGTNPSKANWAKAALIWIAIIVALYLLLITVFGVALAAMS